MAAGGVLLIPPSSESVSSHILTTSCTAHHLQGSRTMEDMLSPGMGGEKLYIFSSHLGLIRCLTPVRVSAIIYFQAFLDKHRNTTNIILPHKLNHGSRMLSKQP